jgi:hypothetical protein
VRTLDGPASGEFAGSSKTSDNRLVEAVPLTEGDPAWVFPGESVTLALMAALVASSERLVETAGLLPGGRAGLSGSGLEYNLFPPWGQCCLHGWAESPDVTFAVEMTPPGFNEAESLGWEVRADISVRCDARYDAACGMHVMEEFTPNLYATPEQAVAAVDRATHWLLARCRVVPPADWRARDPLEPCQGHS